MSLRRCPSCKNQFSVESVCCPICGCEPAKTYVVRAIKWTIIVVGVGWAAQHFISKNHTPAREGSATPTLATERPA